MTPARRTVVVGERLLPGFRIDDAIRVAASVDLESVLSVAVLDRPDGTTVLAVSVTVDGTSGSAVPERLLDDLRTVFAKVWVQDSDVAALAMGDSLT